LPVLVSVWAIGPATGVAWLLKPVTVPDEPVAVQVYNVPAIVLLKAISVVEPLQIMVADGVAVTSGFGLTVIVTVVLLPAQPLAVGVTV